MHAKVKLVNEMLCVTRGNVLFVLLCHFKQMLVLKSIIRLVLKYTGHLKSWKGYLWLKST